jgi:hypothetical protein
MIEMDLTLFGGRGGTAESASYVKGFLKSAMKNADDDDVKADIDAAQFILSRLTKAKSEDKVSPREGFDILHESDLLNEWTRESSVAKYDGDSGKLTIEPGKLTEARREYERFVKDRFRQYYRRTRTTYWKGKKK